MTEQLQITPELIASLDNTTRAKRKEIFLKLFNRYSSLQAGIDDVVARLCEKRALVHLWRSKDPRTIPASKLKVLLKSYL